MQAFDAIVTDDGPVPEFTETVRDVMGVLAVVLNDEAIPHHFVLSFDDAIAESENAAADRAGVFMSG